MISQFHIRKNKVKDEISFDPCTRRHPYFESAKELVKNLLLELNVYQAEVFTAQSPRDASDILNVARSICFSWSTPAILIASLK